MKLWIARDEHGLLSLFKRKPHKRFDEFSKSTYWRIDNSMGNYMCLQESLFSEVTFENSPQEVELKLVNDL